MKKFNEYIVEHKNRYILEYLPISKLDKIQTDDISYLLETGYVNKNFDDLYEYSVNNLDKYFARTYSDGDIIMGIGENARGTINRVSFFKPKISTTTYTATYDINISKSVANQIIYGSSPCDFRKWIEIKRSLYKVSRISYKFFIIDKTNDFYDSINSTFKKLKSINI